MSRLDRPDPEAPLDDQADSDDPFTVLGVQPEDDDATIRRRYLELIRRFPPERAPETFTRIQSAYEALNDPETRLSKILFESIAQDPLGEATEILRRRLRRVRLTSDLLATFAQPDPTPPVRSTPSTDPQSADPESPSDSS